MTQAGAAVTAVDAGYNGSLATGATASFGFNGARPGANPVPNARGPALLPAGVGKTCTLNPTVVELVDGEHDSRWYINNDCDLDGDRYWCVVSNMQRELMRRFGIANPWRCQHRLGAPQRERRPRGA